MIMNAGDELRLTFRAPAPPRRDGPAISCSSATGGRRTAISIRRFPKPSAAAAPRPRRLRRLSGWRTGRRSCLSPVSRGLQTYHTRFISPDGFLRGSNDGSSSTVVSRQSPSWWSDDRRPSTSTSTTDSLWLAWAVLLVGCLVAVKALIGPAPATTLWPGAAINPTRWPDTVSRSKKWQSVSASIYPHRPDLRRAP